MTLIFVKKQSLKQKIKFMSNFFLILRAIKIRNYFIPHTK